MRLRKNLNLPIMVFVLIIAMLAVASCLPVFFKDVDFSVYLSERLVRTDNSGFFTVAVLINEPASFRAVSFCFEISEGLTLLDVSLGEAAENQGGEIFWGYSCDSSFFVHAGFLWQTQPIIDSGTIILLLLTAENEGVLSLSGVECVDDELRTLDVRIKEPNRTLVLSEGK